MSEKLDPLFDQHAFARELHPDSATPRPSVAIGKEIKGNQEVRDDQADARV